MCIINNNNFIYVLETATQGKLQQALKDNKTK
jgi:hypothetical protein